MFHAIFFVVAVAVIAVVAIIAYRHNRKTIAKVTTVVENDVKNLESNAVSSMANSVVTKIEGK